MGCWHEMTHKSIWVNIAAVFTNHCTPIMGFQTKRPFFKSLKYEPGKVIALVYVCIYLSTFGDPTPISVSLAGGGGDQNSLWAPSFCIHSAHVSLRKYMVSVNFNVKSESESFPTHKIAKDQRIPPSDSGLSMELEISVYLLRERISQGESVAVLGALHPPSIGDSEKLQVKP